MRAADLDPSSRARTLYVSRPVHNSDDIRAWARSQGFVSTVQPDSLHVTLAFSKQPVVWENIERDCSEMTCEGGVRMVQPLGDKGAVVLRFEDAALKDRWQALCDAGCKWGYPDYKAHVTLTYAGSDLDLSNIQPYDGPIILGPEKFAEVNENWTSTITEVALNEGLIRIPQATLDATMEFVEQRILWHLHGRFTADMTAKFPEHYAELQRVMADRAIRLPRQKHTIPDSGLEATRVEFPGLDDGIRVVLDWTGAVFGNVPNRGDGETRAGWMPKKRVLLFNLSGWRELSRYPDRSYSPDNLEYVLDTLEQSGKHELRHAVQDTLHADQSKRRPDYATTMQGYYMSPMEFDPQIGSSAADFVALMRTLTSVAREGNRRQPDFAKLMRQFVGASKGDPFNGTPTNDFFKTLKRHAPQRWKLAVRKFFIEVKAKLAVKGTDAAA